VARRVAAVVVVAALAAAGCAEPGPPTLSSESVVAGIPESVWPDAPGLITDVKCPNIDDSVVSQSTVCTARLNGEALTIDVVIAEDGAAATTVRETLFELTKAEAEAADRLSEDLGVPVEVSCSSGVVVAEVGVVVDCVASHDHGSIGFVLEIIDRDGTWSFVIDTNRDG